MFPTPASQNRVLALKVTFPKWRCQLDNHLHDDELPPKLPLYRWANRLADRGGLLWGNARAPLWQFHPLWLCPSSCPKLAGLEAVPWPKTQGPGVPLFGRLVTTQKLMAAIFSAGVARTYLAKWQPLGWEGCQTADLGTGLGEE